MTTADLGAPSVGVRAKRWFSFRNIGAVYIWIALFVIFSIWVPEQFLSWPVWRSVIDINSISAIVAIAVIFPLASGAFDLAVGAQVGLASVVVAYALHELEMSIALTIIVTLILGALIGAVSGLLIVKARIESIIATLGVSSILLALTRWVSGDQQILDLGATFQAIATYRVLDITMSTWIMLVIAIVVWYVLAGTAVGRRIYAVGGNIQTARLAGVNTSAVVILCLVASGIIAACAGVLLTSRIAVGDPTVGPFYLLPAYTAALLGATQFGGGRVNVPGTLIAIYLLATGIKGLQLAGAPPWIPDMFNGIALLVAVAVAMHQRSATGSGGLRQRYGRSGGRQPKESTSKERQDPWPVSE